MLNDEDKKRLQHEVTAEKIAVNLTASPSPSLAGNFGIEWPPWTGNKEKLVKDFEKGFVLNGIQYKPLQYKPLRVPWGGAHEDGAEPSPTGRAKPSLDELVEAAPSVLGGQEPTPARGLRQELAD